MISKHQNQHTYHYTNKAHIYNSNSFIMSWQTHDKHKQVMVFVPDWPRNPQNLYWQTPLLGGSIIWGPPEVMVSSYYLSLSHERSSPGMIGLGECREIEMSWWKKLSGQSTVPISTSRWVNNFFSYTNCIELGRNCCSPRALLGFSVVVKHIMTITPRSNSDCQRLGEDGSLWVWDSALYLAYNNEWMAMTPGLSNHIFEKMGYKIPLRKRDWPRWPVHTYPW